MYRNPRLRLRADAEVPVRRPGKAIASKSLIVVWICASAAVAWVFVNLPIPVVGALTSGPSGYASQFIVPTQTVSNSALKGDRLHPSKPADARMGAGSRAPDRPSVVKDGRKIPEGCEAAFSRLVTKGNFSARCVT
jgi:hypothetical protein